MSEISLSLCAYMLPIFTCIWIHNLPTWTCEIIWHWMMRHVQMWFPSVVALQSLVELRGTLLMQICVPGERVCAEHKWGIVCELNKDGSVPKLLHIKSSSSYETACVHRAFRRP